MLRLQLQQRALWPELLRRDLGHLTARVLEGSWRSAPAPPSLEPAQLERLAAHLVATGLGALACHRIQKSPTLAKTPAGEVLSEALRATLLNQGVYEDRLSRMLERFTAAGVEPLLLKGWGTARRYPGRGLRPLGDIDMVFLPEQEAGALEVIASGIEGADPIVRTAASDIDLEHAFLRADGTRVADLFAASDRVRLGEHRVRVPCAEDDLRLACVHFLLGGGWRALSLCDIALAIERRPAGFDWRASVPTAPERRDWMSVAIGLAAALLGARIADTPFAGADRSVPAWVRRHVLNGFGSRPGDHALLPFFALPRQPGRILAALRARWPRDALQVTILNRRPIPPRIPRRLQLQDAASRLAQAVGDDSRRARHER